MKETVVLPMSATTSQLVQLQLEDKDGYNLSKTRCTIKGEQSLADRISELPDEILVSILSLLSLKEAATTSILSKRWQHKWASTTKLNFDVGNNDHVLRKRVYDRISSELSYQQGLRYADWVSRVLEQHQGNKLESFRACFDLNSRFTSSIDEWLQFAMTKRVQTLELEFYSGALSVPVDHHYTFPLKVLTTTTEHSAFSFNSLKVVRLCHVNVTGQILDHFWSNYCPFLERFELIDSNVSGDLRLVGGCSNLNALKHLAIKHCPGIQTVEIHGANLLSSFFYKSLSINLVMKDVPSLVDVSLFQYGFFHSQNTDCVPLIFTTQLSHVVSQLQILKLDLIQLSRFMYDSKYEIPILANLKHLELIVSPDYRWGLYELNSFMKACPYLHRLTLKLVFAPYKARPVEGAGNFPHLHLKVVELIGYRRRKRADHQLMHIIKSAVSLEKIVIDPVKRWGWPEGMDRGTKEVKKEEKARRHAIKRLKLKLPSTIQFVCL